MMHLDHSTHQIKTIISDDHYNPDKQVNAFLAQNPQARIINAQATFSQYGNIKHHVYYVAYPKETTHE